MLVFGNFRKKWLKILLCNVWGTTLEEKYAKNAFSCLFMLREGSGEDKGKGGHLIVFEL